MTNIFIANLDWDITSEDLRVTFEAFGEVNLAHVVYDKLSKKSKGFGYIEMPNADEAIRAIEALNGMEVNSRMLDVKIASPKSSRPLLEKKVLEKKVYEKKPFEKKSFNQTGVFQKRENSFQPRQNDFQKKDDVKLDKPVENTKNSNNTDRVMRPRKSKDI